MGVTPSMQSKGPAVAFMRKAAGPLWVSGKAAPVSEVSQLSSPWGQIRQQTSFTHKTANIMAVEKQKLDFPKCRVQAGRLHICKATSRSRSEILQARGLGS